MFFRRLNKKGVSLVTVLIFMMVATIAATATYKWLNSVGFTSADRMAIAEAKESSRAGLQAVRSWMTYHANEVGAVVRQYFDEGKKPVSLSEVIHMNSNKQRASVWLVGVEALSSSYKFTVVSTGYSRSDTKYSETSVLNVRGLYKVKEPLKIEHKPLDYHYSYFGGSVVTAEKTKASSMLINGDWSGNPSGVTQEFVVTGNASLNGNDIALGQNACIGGDLSANNTGARVSNLYVHGDANPFVGEITSSAYFNGDLILGSTNYHNYGLSGSGDLTVNQTFKLNESLPYKLDGNFCMPSGSTFDVNNLNQGFEVAKNVCLQGTLDNYHTMYGNVNLGKPNPGMNTKVNGALKCNNGVNVYCNGKAAAGNEMYVADPGRGSSCEPCDQEIVSFCQNKLGAEVAGTGCDNSDFKIPDMLTTAYKYFSERTGTPCANIRDENITSKFNMETLNDCYTDALKSSQLFNGYLVVKINSTSNPGSSDPAPTPEASSGDITIFSNPQGKLNGKFIFYATDSLKGTISLPPMEAGSGALLYLGGGANTINGVGDGPHNYFFYSKKNISKLLYDGNPRIWSGSFYMTAENCAKIEKIDHAEQTLQYDQNLVQDLLDHSIICNSSEVDCGYAPSTGSGDDASNGEANVAGYDRFYVATSPQLSISLESQRKNNNFEEPTNVTVVKPSIVVLPRIMYLKRSPKGRLSDYYTVHNLNGIVEETHSPENMNCGAGIPIPGALVTDANPELPPGVYKCIYTPDNNPSMASHVWLVIDGEIDGFSEVSFKEPGYSRIIAGSNTWTDVYMVVGNEQKNPVVVDVSRDHLPDGWIVDAVSSVVSVDGDASSDGFQKYKVTLTPGTETLVFRVKANAGADNDQMRFTIDGLGDNAHVGQYQQYTLQMNGDGRVNRVDVYPDLCDEINGVSCAEIATRENCPKGALLLTGDNAGEWVYPNCAARSAIEENKSWLCGFDGTPLKLLQGNDASSLCDVFIYDSTIANPVDGSEYTLYASYKAKPRTLTVKLQTEKNSKVEVRISKEPVEKLEGPGITVHTCEDDKDPCVYDVAAGYYVSLRALPNGEENFSTWVFNNENPTGNVSPYDFVVTVDTVVTAIFGKNGEHCGIGGTFDHTRIWCDNHPNTGNPKSEYDDCIDRCNSAGHLEQGGYCYTKAASNYGTQMTSKWLITRANDNHDYMDPDLDTTGTADDPNVFIHYDNGKHSSSGNGSISYLMNRMEAGNHGVMESDFKACVAGKKNDILNSGFIVRSSSNSDNYVIIQIMGEKQNNGSYKMKAMECIGDGTGNKNVNKAQCDNSVYFDLDVSASDFAEDNRKTVFHAIIQVGDPTTTQGANGDVATITLIANGQSSTAKLNLPGKDKFTFSNREDAFIGVSLAEDCFSVNSITWDSYDWEEVCGEENIQLTCSFAATYLAGMLPVGEEVYPWVGTSSWFQDPDNPYMLRDGCKLSYHYNGCDIPSNYVDLRGGISCSAGGQETENNYSKTGASAQTLKSKNYVFTEAGLHGFVVGEGNSDKKARDASIVMDCSSIDETKVFTKSCGSFNVGALASCNQTIEFWIDKAACTNTTECVVNVVGGHVNMRSAALVGTIMDLPETDVSGGVPVVNIVLTDMNGHSSQMMRTTGNGQFSRDVNLYSDMLNFNPEKVATIKLVSTEPFTLASLRSECGNSIGISDCSAQLVGDEIILSSNILNPEKATCKVAGNDNDYKFAEADCPSNGVFKIPAPDLQSELDASGADSRNYTFTITAKSKDNENLVISCPTDPMTVNSSGLWCHFAGGVNSVATGELLPAIEFGIPGCKSSVCDVDATVTGSTDVAHPQYKSGEASASWAPGFEASEGETYTYNITYNGMTCSQTISTIDADDGGLVSNCMIVNDKFTADLNLDKSSSVGLSFTDVLGNIVVPFPKQTMGPSDTKYVSGSLAGMVTGGNGFVVLSVDGIGACSERYIVSESVDCGFVGGEFTATNNTNNTYSVSLECGNSVVKTDALEPKETGSWDAYLSSHTDCEKYKLKSGGDVLCEVKNPAYAVSSSSESSSSSLSSSSESSSSSVTSGTVSAECGIYDASGSRVTAGYVGTSYTLKINNFTNVDNPGQVTVNGSYVTYSGGEASYLLSERAASVATYAVRYDGRQLCGGDVQFTWKQMTVPTATCAIYDNNDREVEVNSAYGVLGKNYTFKAIINNPDGLSVMVPGQTAAYTQSGSVSYQFTAGSDGPADGKEYAVKYNGESICSKTFKWTTPTPSASCRIYNSNGVDVTGTKGKKNTTYTFKVVDVIGVPEGGVVTLSPDGSFKANGNNGNMTCSAKYGKTTLCEVTFKWGN